MHSRRSFLKGAGVAGFASTMLPGQVVSHTTTSGQRNQAKNLIFLVVDGMCNGTLGLAHHWNLRNMGAPLNWMQLYSRDDLVRAFQETASASSPVTDSAAAASSWGSGTRVMNRAINTTSQGESLTPLYTYAKKAGKRTGLVSTCRISHATPAGFAASIDHRDKEHAIVKQYLDREIDLLLGGGASKFVETLEDGTKIDYFEKFAGKEYRIVKTLEELERLSSDEARVLGVFSDSHIPYAIDRKNDASLREIPSLAQMFEAALKNLDDSEGGFLLQVEGGRVDHAGHANDPGAILHEMLDFDACIPLALDYIEKNPDTLLIVTTDHGTGGCQLDGLGSGYNESGPALDRINTYRYSFEWLEKRFRTMGGFNALPFTLATGITPTPEQVAEMDAAIADPEVKYLTSKIAQVFADELTQTSATGWSSHNHTSENVEFLAFGPGSERVTPFIKNYEVFDLVMDSLELR